MLYNSNSEDDDDGFSVPLPEGFVPDQKMFENEKSKDDNQFDESKDDDEFDLDDGVSPQILISS